MVKGWTECSITDVLRPDGIKIGPFGSRLKKEMLINDGSYKVYGQENVYQNDFSIGNRFMTKNHYDSLKSCEILPGDFLMSSMGTIGECAIVPENIQQGIMDSHLIRLRLDERKIFPPYLLQLYSKEFSYLLNQTQSLSVGGIMDGLSVGIVSKLKVHIPKDIQEQKKIVSVLSDIDVLIANLGLQVEKDKRLKQAFLMHLFPRKGQIRPDMRLPGCLGEWKEWRIADLAHRFYNGGTPRTSVNKYWNGSIPWIQSQDIIENQLYGVKPRKNISNIAVAESNAKIIPAESIAVVTRVGVGKLAYMPFEYSTSQDFVSLSELLIDAKCLTYALYVMLQNEKKMTQGTSIKGITIKDFLSKKIFLPKEENEQIAIGNILYDIDKNIELNSEKLKKYRALRQGMMEQLLTGKIRL